MEETVKEGSTGSSKDVSSVVFLKLGPVWDTVVKLFFIPFMYLRYITVCLK